jgi:hypothetical protein
MLESVLQYPPLSDKVHNVFLDSSTAWRTLSFCLSMSAFQELYMLLMLDIFDEVYVYRQELVHINIIFFSENFMIQIQSS